MKLNKIDISFFSFVLYNNNIVIRNESSFGLNFTLYRCCGCCLDKICINDDIIVIINN
jgi:hypothetical protein